MAWKPSTTEDRRKSSVIEVAVEVVIGFALSESGESFDMTRWIGLLFSSSGWKHVMWFLVFVVFPKYFSWVRHIVHVVVLVQEVFPSTSWPKCFHTLALTAQPSHVVGSVHTVDWPALPGAFHQHYAVKEHLENEFSTFVDAAAQMISSFSCLTDMQNWSEGFWMFPGLSYHRTWSITQHSDVIKHPKCTDTNRFINNRMTHHVEVDARPAVG